MRKEGFIKGDKVIITKEWKPGNTIIRLDRTGKEAIFVEYTDNQPKGYQYEVKIEGYTCLVWDIDKIKTIEEEQIKEVKINIVDKQPSINLEKFNKDAQIILDTVVKPQIEKYKEIEPQTQLDELNDYLRMLADMDKIGIRRKIILLEGYLHKIKK